MCTQQKVFVDLNQNIFFEILFWDHIENNFAACAYVPTLQSFQREKTVFDRKQNHYFLAFLPF